MKKIIFAAAVGVLLVACNSVAKYEAPINTLATQWDSTQTIVASFASTLNQEIANAQNMAAGMQVAPEVSAKMKPEDMTKLQELQAAFQGQSNILNELNNEVSAFVATWGEKAQALTALKDGLTAGKMPEGIDATISELQTLVGEAGTKVADWTGKVDAAKAAMQTAATQSSDLIAAATAAVAGKKK